VRAHVLRGLLVLVADELEELGVGHESKLGRRRPRSTFGALEIDITITDPTYYTKPWTATPKLRLVPDTELFEFICNENEKSSKHMGPHIK